MEFHPPLVWPLPTKSWCRSTENAISPFNVNYSNSHDPRVELSLRVLCPDRRDRLIVGLWLEMKSHTLRESI